MGACGFKPQDSSKQEGVAPQTVEQFSNLEQDKPLAAEQRSDKEQFDPEAGTMTSQAQACEAKGAISVEVLKLDGTPTTIKTDCSQSVRQLQDSVAATLGHDNPLVQCKLSHRDETALLPAHISLADAGVKDGSQLCVVIQNPPLVATTCHDRTGQIWDVLKGERLHMLKGHDHVVFTIVVSRDNLSVFTCSVDHTVKEWSIEDGSCKRTFTCSVGQVNKIALSLDGLFLLTASDDAGLQRTPCFAKIWSLETGDCIRQFSHEKSVRDADFSPDGALIVTASVKSLWIWSTTSDSETPIRRCDGHTDSARYGTSISACNFSPDGKRIVSAGGKDLTARVWSVETGECIQVLQGHGDSVVTAMFSPCGLMVLTASEDKTARIWVDGECIQVFEGHTANVHSAEFSSDGTFVVTAGDKTAKVWNAGSGKCLQTVVAEDHMFCATFTA